MIYLELKNKWQSYMIINATLFWWTMAR